MAAIQKITPFLWLDGTAREAAEFYVSIFQNSRIVSSETYVDGPAAGSSTVAFELGGVQFVAFDGIPAIEFTEAISFMVSCDSQGEIDHLWDNLTAGGTEIQCGWLKDRYGVTWQIIPTDLPAWLMNGPNANRVMEVMLPMKKLDMQKLLEAHQGG
ncbi:MAG: VOC family protein [Chloroflexi bacterium]|nr:VOC family protein [Chloroflexota bacterium]